MSAGVRDGTVVSLVFVSDRLRPSPILMRGNSLTRYDLSLRFMSYDAFFAITMFGTGFCPLTAVNLVLGENGISPKPLNTGATERLIGTLPLLTIVIVERLFSIVTESEIGFVRFCDIFITNHERFVGTVTLMRIVWLSPFAAVK